MVIDPVGDKAGLELNELRGLSCIGIILS